MEHHRGVTMRTLLLFVSPFLWATGLSAQLSALAPGQRVRLSGCIELAADHVQCAGRIDGTVVETTSDNLIIRRPRDSGVATIPVNSIQRLRAATGRKRRTVTGAVLGAIVGAFVGGVIGKRVRPGTPSSPGECINATMWLICTRHPGEPSGLRTGALGGAGLGVGVGALLGSLIRSTQWQDLWLGRPRAAAFVTAGGRFGLVASMRF